MRWISFSVLFLVFCSFASTQGSGKETKTTQSLKEFPYITLETMDNGDVPSYFGADIVDNPLSQEGQKIFNDNIVYNVNSTYKLYGKENTVNYYIIVFDFNKTISKTDNVKKNDVIGKRTGSYPKMMVFSKTIDPFFVITCKNMPYYYDEFYWFEGSFLFPSPNPKWLTFEPVDNIEKVLIDMAEHAEESQSSATYYPDATYRFKTKLNKYPRETTADEKVSLMMYEYWTYNRTGLTTHVSEIQAGKYKYFLCWQNGFDKYLSKEYKLKKDIWIFGIVATYSVFADCGYIFVRDFSLESMEEIYESRLKMINKQLKQ